MRDEWIAGSVRRNFFYHKGQLQVEGMAVPELAHRFGTPSYIYSRSALEQAVASYAEPLKGMKHLIAYAVKANGNLAVLDILARLGCGFDVVSGGELLRVIEAGADPALVVFSGVGKREDELALALRSGIRCINVESRSELESLCSIARDMQITAPVALRVNPDVDPKTHPYITTGMANSKFGIAWRDAMLLARECSRMSDIRLCGLSCHIGSDLKDINPWLEAARHLLDMAKQLRGEDIVLEHIDMGGGLGINYTAADTAPQPETWMHELRRLFSGSGLSLMIEPGRSIVGSAGILLTRVLYIKSHQQRRIAIVDAGMNDLIRPALYQAQHPIMAVQSIADRPQYEATEIVGPVCESSDCFAPAIHFPVEAEDLLAIGAAGAYGFSMSSQYNARPRAAEVMVDQDHAYLVRRRETVEDLWRGETRIPF